MKIKILLIKFRNIGDVLLSTPLINNLKLNFQDCIIDYVINAECEEILKDNPKINQLFLYERKKIKSQWFLPRLIEEYRFIKKIRGEHYDIVINLTEGDRGIFLGLFSGAKKILTYPPKTINFFLFKKKISFNYSDKYLHTVEKDLNFCKMLEVDISTKKVEIFHSIDSMNKINKILTDKNIDKFVVVHPVSRWMFKSWDNEKMALVIDYIVSQLGFNVVITSSNDRLEKYELENISNLCKEDVITLSGCLSISELSCLISKSVFFLGVDSAPMHIAAANNIPVNSLFGASYPSIWGPWDENAKNSYKNIDGFQKSGMHKIISRKNHEIYYENLDKKSRGMEQISYKDVINLLKM